MQRERERERKKVAVALTFLIMTIPSVWMLLAQHHNGLTQSLFL